MGWGGWEHSSALSRAGNHIGNEGDVGLCCHREQTANTFVQGPGFVWLLRPRKQQQIKAMAHQKLGFLGAPL